MPMIASIDTPPRAVCVLRLSAIGDTCQVLPVVRTLQRAWPETQFTWLIGTLEASLMKGVAGIEFITFDKSRGRHGRRELRQLLADRQFDALLHMHASMRANLVSRCVDARLRLGFDRARARDFQWLFTNQRIAAQPRQHVMDGLFGFAAALGVRERDLRWDIPVGDDDKDFASRVRGDASRLVVVSPCSSQRARNYRNWPRERFVDVIDYLVSAHTARVVVTGGPSKLEREYGQVLAAAAPGKVQNVVGQTSLKRLYALIDAADAVICPDSGPAHLGTAAGTPVIGLYAGSNPGRTGPYLSQQWVINKYPDAVRRAFGTDVEDVRWGRRVRDPRVMELITVDDVIAKLDALFG